MIQARKSNMKALATIPKIATIGNEFFTEFVGPVYNEAIRFDKICDTSYKVTGMCFPNAREIFLTDCNPNFPFFELRPERFPKVRVIWFMSRYELQVLSRFKCHLYLSEQHTSPWYLRSNCYGTPNSVFMSKDFMYNQLRKLGDEPAEVYLEDKSVSDDILRSSLPDHEKRKMVYELVSGNGHHSVTHLKQ